MSALEEASVRGKWIPLGTTIAIALVWTALVPGVGQAKGKRGPDSATEVDIFPRP